MFESRPNWPVIMFIVLLVTAALLSLASKMGWIELKHRCGQYGCKQAMNQAVNSSPAATTTATATPATTAAPTSPLVPVTAKK